MSLLDDFGYDWYCDGCKTLMNSQPGFTASNGVGLVQITARQ